jgi:Spy/CpxP family protein refolding chaperone
MKKNLLVLFAMAALLVGGVWQAAFAAPKASKAPASPPAVSIPESAVSPAPEQQQVKTIWDYEKDLGLTQDQIQKMKDLFSKMQTQLADLNKKLEGAGQELKDMLTQGGNPDQIKAKLQEISNIRADINYIDIDTAQKINKTMSEKQLKDWREIQTSAQSAQAGVLKYEKELTLTPDQVKKIKDLYDVLRAKLSDLSNDQQAKRQELKDLLDKEAASDVIKAKYHEIWAIAADISYSDITTTMQVNSVLTKDQLKKLADIIAAAQAQEAAKSTEKK